MHALYVDSQIHNALIYGIHVLFLIGVRGVLLQTDTAVNSSILMLVLNNIKYVEHIVLLVAPLY